MSEPRITYVGSFPPPFGGVTVKNSLLYKHLAQRLNIKRLNSLAARHGSVRDALGLAGSLLGRNGSIVIGMSYTWRVRFSRALAVLNPAKARRSIIIVMGGASPTQDDVRAFRLFKRVYVETEGMKNEYEAAGLSNVDVYPNCRERHVPQIEPRPRKPGQPLRCVYFSLIAKVKGASSVLTVAEAQPDMEFHFYGRIDGAYEDEFKRRGDSLTNVSYHGVFDSVHNDVVVELAQYDVHLFPTRWHDEGVPGVIIESKIAGLPTITTDICRNAELIEDGVDGFLLDVPDQEADAERIESLLRRLDGDEELLLRMKRASLSSAERFYMDTYIAGMADLLVGSVPRDNNR